MQDALLYGFFAVIVSQGFQPDKTFLARWTHRYMFHAGFNFVFQLAESGDKLREGHSGGNHTVNIFPDQAPPGGFAF
ncbi:MAG: hypothetical protein APF77_13135, partial [Clostridia bacterium BRH_c25]